MTSTPRNVVITGAGSGLGRQMAIALAARGHRLILAGRREEALRETAEQAGGDCTVVPADVTEATDVERLFEHAAELPRLDVLINNAGTFAGGGPIDVVTDDAWDTAVAVNLTGYFRCARAAWRLMKTQSPSGGRIINNGSISAQVPRINSIVYTATKHAVTGLSKSLELDGRTARIRCTQIDIGNAASPMTVTMERGIPQADGSVRREPTFDPRHVGELIAHVVELPLEVSLPFVTLAAASMPYNGRG